MLRSAEVAKMLPWVPAAMTATEAMKTMKSKGRRGSGGAGFSQTPVVWVTLQVPKSVLPPKLPPPHPGTYNAEGFPGKSEASPPASVAAAAAGRPDADDVLHAEHHDHDELLSGGQ